MPDNTTDHDLLLRIDIRTRRLKEDVEELKRAVYGNGQPGDLDKLDARLVARLDRVDSRIKILEEHRWKAVGVVAVLLALFSFLSPLLVAWLRQ